MPSVAQSLVPRVFRSLLALLVPAVLAAQGTGTLEGTVVDAGSKRPLANVQVTIAGTGALVGAPTNAQGFFRILNVASGPRIVRALVTAFGGKQAANDFIRRLEWLG